MTLSELIAAKRDEIVSLRKTLELLVEAEEDLKAMIRTQHLLSRGTTTNTSVSSSSSSSDNLIGHSVAPERGGSPQTLAEWIAAVIPEGRGLHADRIVDALESVGKKTSKNSVVNTLLRHSLPGGRFRRVGPNTFVTRARSYVLPPGSLQFSTKDTEGTQQAEEATEVAS